jgi:uncharacterized protein
MDQPDSPAAGSELIRLDRAESLRLLASAQVGRLIFTMHALPTLRLMNFALVDGLIVVRTAADTTVARKANSMVVAFEVDDLDPATSSGWSVIVIGYATLVTDPALIARFQRMALKPWAPGDRDQFMQITAGLVEGRRAHPAATTTDPASEPITG